MAEACAEVLPCRGGCARVVGREEHGEHEDKAEGARDADKDAEGEGESDGELAVGNEEGYGSGVWEHEAAENWSHERVRAAFEEAVDPVLKAAVKSELGAEDFVLAKDEEEDADADAKHG